MSRRGRKRRIRGALFIIALALLVAGFIIRRFMIAGAIRPPAHHASADYSNNPNPEGEHITNADRERLNRLLKEKTGGGR